jgi:hypothetical protein
MKIEIRPFYGIVFIYQEIDFEIYQSSYNIWSFYSHYSHRSKSFKGTFYELIKYIKLQTELNTITN